MSSHPSSSAIVPAGRDRLGFEPADRVTAWTKVRGDSLISAGADGSLYLAGFGERCVLAADPPARSDIRLRMRTTIDSGPGFGVLVRAGVDPAGRLSGYAVELDAAAPGGVLSVRLLSADRELAAPLAEGAAPNPLVPLGIERIVDVAMRGDSIDVCVDGTRGLSIPSLNLAAEVATIAAGARQGHFPLPTGTGFGLRVSFGARLGVAGIWARPAAGTDRNGRP